MGYGYYGYGPMMGYGYGDWFGWIFMILFWALVIAAIVFIVRRFGHGRRHGWHDHGHLAVDILKERYAKGEIDRKEFEEKKKDIEA
ncbi:MAG TPA: SHOCT domain-containing protein [Candidatus Paceibacterota bacterium]|nr:SHOCT domain-containing protein [Candidatus Paceibacterota bacterium]